MPNRIIKESICTSDTIDQMTWFEECFWHRLIVNCDDYGRFDARPTVLRARLFPLKERMTLKDVSSALQRLAGLGCVVLYECNGQPYLCLPTWEVHQTIRAKKSKYPSPDNSGKSSEIICKQMQADTCICPRNPIQSESNTIAPYNPPVGGTPAPNQQKPKRGKSEELTKEEREARVNAALEKLDPDVRLQFFDFMADRKERHKPLTYRAVELNVDKLIKLSKDPCVQSAIIKQSVEKAWSGLFELKEEYKHYAAAARKTCAMNHNQRKYSDDELKKIGIDLLEDT